MTGDPRFDLRRPPHARTGLYAPARPAVIVPPSWRTCYPWHAPNVECTDLPDVYAEEWARHTAERRRIDAHNAEMARAQVALPGVTP